MNKINYLLWVVSLLLMNNLYSQVGIGNTNPRALLDISASNLASPNYSDGFLIPRMNSFPATNPLADQNAMMVYLNSNLTGVNISGTAKNYSLGFYYWDNALTDWIKMTQKPAWHVEGNENAISGTHFLGTTNTEEVDFRVNTKLVARLTELGQLELQSDERSLFVGFEAGENYDPVGTLSQQNVFVGYQSGKSTVSGRDNVAVGALAFTNNISGDFNAVLGDEALESNTTGSYNTAIGNDTLRDNTIGNNNTAVGRDALQENIDASGNVAVGATAMQYNVSSSNNVAVGNSALLNMNSGGFNTIIGNNAGNMLNSGFSNIYIGSNSGSTVSALDRSISIGNSSETAANSTVGIGHRAITNSEFAIALGFEAEANNTSSISLGRRAMANGNNSVAIGNTAAATKNNQIVLGNTSVTEVLTSGVIKADSFLATGTGTTYADYVFEDYYKGSSKIKSDYKFNSLEKAEAFVKKNGHLPGVKSYTEVMKNGFKLDLTEATITNLEKIEEQFLYITQLKQEIKNQDIAHQKQEEKIKSMEERLMAVEQLLKK